MELNHLNTYSQQLFMLCILHKNLHTCLQTILNHVYIRKQRSRQFVKFCECLIQYRLYWCNTRSTNRTDPLKGISEMSTRVKLALHRRQSQYIAICSERSTRVLHDTINHSNGIIYVFVKRKD